MRKFLNTIFFVAAILFFVIFALSNVQTIQLSFLHLQIRPIPVSLLILIPFLMGIVLGSLLNLMDRISLKREVKRLKKDLHQKNGQPRQKDGPASSTPDDNPQGSGTSL
jgi:uncharacterized integral membrane protein